MTATTHHDNALFGPVLACLLMAMLCLFGTGLLLGSSLQEGQEPTVNIVGDLGGSAYNSDVLVVRNNWGGSVATYAQRWEAVTQMQLDVVIDGDCLSACTHVLWQVPAERVCVTENARFGFHLASIGGIPLPELTEEIDAHYPAPVREWLATQGQLSVEMMVYMPRELLLSIYRQCGDISFIYGE